VAPAEKAELKKKAFLPPALEKVPKLCYSNKITIV
jgi:hypothetical protein